MALSPQCGALVGRRTLTAAVVCRYALGGQPPARPEIPTPRTLSAASCGATAADLRVVAAFLREHAPRDGLELHRPPNHDAFSSLWHVDISGNREIGDPGALLLATILRTNQTLRRLSARACGLSNAGCASVAQALRFNNTLKRLYLGGNDASSLEAGVGQHFGASLGNRADVGLEVLELHDKLMRVQELCGYGPGSARDVDLSATAAAAVGGSDGANASPLCASELAFVTALVAHNPTLRSLSVAGSVHTERHVLAMATAVRSNSALAKILLSRNPPPR